MSAKSQSAIRMCTGSRNVLPSWGPQVWEGLPHGRGGGEPKEVRMMVVAGNAGRQQQAQGRGTGRGHGEDRFACGHRCEGLLPSSHHGMATVGARGEDRTKGRALSATAALTQSPRASRKPASAQPRQAPGSR